MLTVISDMHGPVAVVALPHGADLVALREEYEAVLSPGPNPWCHESDPDRQRAWVDRVHARVPGRSPRFIITRKYFSSIALDFCARSMQTFAHRKGGQAQSTRQREPGRVSGRIKLPDSGRNLGQDFHQGCSPSWDLPR